MYINLQTNAVVSKEDIKKANPNTSFPLSFPVPDGYAFVFETPKPAHDETKQSVKETAPSLTEKGTYQQEWEIINDS